MIENIHSNEGEDQDVKNIDYTFKPPKNIKQIGESTSQKKIYVEDYVFTYIKELVKKEFTDCKIIVLLGHYIKTQDARIIMINGAVEAQGIQYDAENVFNNDTWTAIYENIKRYFNDIEVVGWCIGGPNFILDNNEKLKKIHLDNFAGVDKALLKYDSIENEESFYLYEHGTLNCQDGYYIYFDKNDDMQNYIIDHKPEDQKTISKKEAKAMNEYKEEMKEQKVQENNKSVLHLLYAAGSLMAVIIIVVFAAMINNNNKIKNLENSVDELNAYLSAGGDQPLGEQDVVNASNNTAQSMEVETISGNLNSIKDEKVIGDRSDEATLKQEESDKKKESSEEKDSKNDSATKEQSPQKEDEKDSESEQPGSENEENAKETLPDQDAKKGQEGDKQGEQKSENSVQTSTEVKYYEVKKGDSLVGISFQLYGSGDYVTKIMELNNIEDMDTIYYGQKLIVP